jgi:hypothetical protein
VRTAEEVSTCTQNMRPYILTSATLCGSSGPLHGSSNFGSFSGGGSSNFGRSVISNLPDKATGQRQTDVGFRGAVLAGLIVDEYAPDGLRQSTAHFCLPIVLRR